MLTYYMENGEKKLTQKLGEHERFVEFEDLSDELKEEAKATAKMVRLSSKQRLGGIVYHKSGKWSVVLEDLKKKAIAKTYIANEVTGKEQGEIIKVMASNAKDAMQKLGVDDSIKPHERFSKFYTKMYALYEEGNPQKIEYIIHIDPQRKYDNKNTTRINLKLNNASDADIIEKLNEVDNKQGYIKECIRKDLKR